jgi:hypothetical protein
MRITVLTAASRHAEIDDGEFCAHPVSLPQKIALFEATNKAKQNLPAFFTASLTLKYELLRARRSLLQPRNIGVVWGCGTRGHFGDGAAVAPFPKF